LPIWSADPGSNTKAQHSPHPGRLTGLQGNWVQRLRLWSGMVLMAYAATHLANHAVGLWSLADAEVVRLYFTGVWRSAVGTPVLIGCASVHVALALAKLYAGKTWRLPWWQWAQIGLGLLIPVVLVEHLLATRIGHEIFEYEDSYAFITAVSWPGKAWDMIWLIAVVWLHGCIGVHYWARLYPLYSRLRPWLLSAAVLLPVLGFAGYAGMGEEIRGLMALDPNWFPDMLRQVQFPGKPVIQFVTDTHKTALWVIAALLTSLALVRLTWVWQARWGDIELRYPQGRKVTVPAGITVLEASQRFGIPHASVCGGRGRCSTCRVRVGAGAERLPPPSEAEQRVLQRVSAPPGVRLARQIAIHGPLEITPLLPAVGGPVGAGDDSVNRHGTDRELAILFSDIRSFTQLAEHRLPYDVVFLLNQYFKVMGEQVEAHGGHVDKFIGDGMMALFGLATDRDTACRQAVAAIKAMSHELEVLNADLATELTEPLRIGIGVHVGTVIVGQIGHGPAAHLTAIGDTVNVASRLEPLSKEFQAEAVISLAVAEAAGLDTARYRSAELPLRGRSRPLAAVVIDRGTDL
jgi:adenylate cyclase